MCPPALPETELSAFFYSRPSVHAAFEARRSVLRHENVRSQAIPSSSSFVPPCPRSVPTERTQQKGSTNDRTFTHNHLRDSQFFSMYYIFQKSVTKIGRESCRERDCKKV